jgi:CheY-like chemotaxis protein
MSPVRLLIIDDDEPVLRLISAIGENCGMEVTATSVPKDFLATLEGNQPDIVVLDLVMPRFDGIEVLKRMNDNQIDSKIILISGAEKNLLDRAGKLASAWGLHILASFRKPLDPGMIEDMFRKAIADN